MDWVLYVFDEGTATYLVPAESEDDAWNQLQKKLSWNMELVKQLCKIVCVMNANSSIVKIK